MTPFAVVLCYLAMVPPVTLFVFCVFQTYLADEASCLAPRYAAMCRACQKACPLIGAAWPLAIWLVYARCVYAAASVLHFRTRTLKKGR